MGLDSQAGAEEEVTMRERTYLHHTFIGSSGHDKSLPIPPDKRHASLEASKVPKSSIHIFLADNSTRGNIRTARLFSLREAFVRQRD